MDWNRRSVWIPFLLAGLVTGCGQSALTRPSPTGPVTSSPASPAGSASAICAGGPLDTASTVGGKVSERTPDGIQPISGAIVELFSSDGGDSTNSVPPDPVKQTVTRADGGYYMCLPPPFGSTGGTGPDGQSFQVRVRKTGYGTASVSFRFAYSVWDYGGVEVSLELVRN